MTKGAGRVRGVLLVDHGTRSEAANATLLALAEAVARARPDWLVEAAHMELTPPDVGTAIDVLVERGAHEIHVHLHFLVAGYHVRESLPALVARARERHPSIAIELTDPLGDDPRLLEIVLDRLDARTGRD
ncbi:MAG TPA: CbiX/SirB N-terminal domain-containing protein [Myxococcota bacterium]|nr:CbiX/SirB N-terminal domain-containing protein [Myxococcota bacterium]